jgi:hypothetical protein
MPDQLLADCLPLIDVLWRSSVLMPTIFLQAAGTPASTAQHGSRAYSLTDPSVPCTVIAVMCKAAYQPNLCTRACLERQPAYQPSLPGSNRQLHCCKLCSGKVSAACNSATTACAEHWSTLSTGQCGCCKLKPYPRQRRGRHAL